MRTLLIDVPLYSFRMYYGAPDLTTEKGIPSGYEFMMLRNLSALEKKYKKIILCFDKGGKNKRQKIEELYKENRKEVEGMFQRFNDLLPALRNKYTFAIVEGMEADDVIFNLCHSIDGEIDILTNDKDMFQCISESVTVVTNSRYYGSRRWDEKLLKDRYKIRPHQWLYYRAYTGDASDNLRGVPRISRDLVSEACRALVKEESHRGWSYCIFDIYEYLKQRTGNKVRSSLETFYAARQAHKNFQVMAPIIGDVELQEPEENGEWVKALNKFELESLKPETEF